MNAVLVVGLILSVAFWCGAGSLKQTDEYKNDKSQRDIISIIGLVFMIVSVFLAIVIHGRMV